MDDRRHEGRLAHDLSADETTRGDAVFPKGDGQRAQRIESGTRLFRLRLAVREDGIIGSGRPTVASGRVHERRMASATATRMEEAFVCWCSSKR